MKLACIRTILAISMLFSGFVVAHESPKELSVPGNSLDSGLSPLHHAVSTKNKQAQAYFDQGLKLVYAFNHEAALASFVRAIELDPHLAMAAWGMAYALGPNINQPMSEPAHKLAYGALQQAIVLKKYASASEGAYIDALSKRYSADPKADSTALNVAYKDAMADLSRRYPNDVDAAVLYAESVMDLHPWKLWKADGTPEEGTLEAIAALEKALKRQPNHIGANHYYVHAIEMSPYPEKALASARRLETLAPSAGHLVHMPAHIYIRTGDYLAAARSNIAAAHADERLIAAGGQSGYLTGYYGHNLHFLAVSYAYAGNAEQAIAAANKLADMVRPKLKEAPYLDSFYATPALIYTLFDRWDDILALPEAPFEAPVSTTLWHFARSIAYAGKGRNEDAQQERSKFIAAKSSTGEAEEYGNNRSRAVLEVALHYLDGRLALFAKDAPAAVLALREAADAEDKLSYDEPPNWYLSSGWMLGNALLQEGDAVGAEAAFRNDLKHNIASGRSLHGLQLALNEQGKPNQAEQARKQFVQAWRGADITLQTR
ncbi:hypothetical protein GCM10011396_16220 [Undibacterium terreum]|uniref:Tetratricopeptide repeat-containing protein n=2 Tax=Undibacterium terreum TaxID=1224302 RepID=A0A916UF04_9BURK|nr:hypothetical protein GCM10011396_16220 [Undibacterium terreum]